MRLLPEISRWGTAAFLNIDGIWLELDKSICHHLYSFLLESAYLLLLLFPCVEWIRYIKIIFLSVWIYLFHLVSSRRRLSAVITAVVCEGKVPRIDNGQEEALKLFFIYTHDSACVYTMNLIHIKLIIHFWFKGTILYESVYLFWLKTMKKTNGDANRSHKCTRK